MKEFEINEIINQIRLETRENQICDFFVTLKHYQQYLTGKYPKSFITAFNILDYYYSFGYEHFRAIEWGFTDINKYNNKDKLVTKPYGKLIKTIYNLCKECHALQDVAGVNVPYKNAYRWFISNLSELLLYDLEYLSIPDLNKKEVSMLDMWSERIKCFKSLECTNPNDFIYKAEYNPFKQGTLLYSSSGLLILIEIAYRLSLKIPKFNTTYWLPFIEAQEEIVQKLKNNPYVSDLRINPYTQEYQTRSQTKTGKLSKFKKPRKL